MFLFLLVFCAIILHRNVLPSRYLTVDVFASESPVRDENSGDVENNNVQTESNEVMDEEKENKSEDTSFTLDSQDPTIEEVITYIIDDEKYRFLIINSRPHLLSRLL